MRAAPDIHMSRGRPVLATPDDLVMHALCYAAETNLIDRVRLILRHMKNRGIDMDATGDGPRPRHTVHDLAVISGNTQIADLLAVAGATASPLDPAEQLVAACLRADRASVERLLAADPGLAQRVDVEWWQPMHRAAFLDRPDAIVVGASVGFPIDDEQGGPLHVAALFGHLEVVKTLIRLGADPMAEVVNRPGPGTTTSMRWRSSFWAFAGRKVGHHGIFYGPAPAGLLPAAQRMGRGQRQSP